MKLIGVFVGNSDEFMISWLKHTLNLRSTASNPVTAFLARLSGIFGYVCMAMSFDKTL